MRQFTLMSKSGSKGAIFAIDSAVAVTLAIIVVATASYFAAYTESEPMAKIQMYKTAYDLLAVMDYQGYFDRFNATEMGSLLTSALQPSMNMQINLTVYNSSQSTLTIGESNVSTNNSVMYGDRIATVRNEPAVARFAIWQ